MLDHQYVLTLSCPDRPGIVSAVSTFLAHNGQNILDAQQFDDMETGQFFMRVVFAAADLAVALAALQTGFTAIAERFGMDWQMRATRRRVMLLVSKSDHCLVDILYRWLHRRTQNVSHRDYLQSSARDLQQSDFRRFAISLFAGKQRHQARAGDCDLAIGMPDQD
jgi:formyltetrahydrofolate hydrolase